MPASKIKGQCDLSQSYNSADIFMFISTHIAGKTSKYEDIRQAIEESEKTEFDKSVRSGESIYVYVNCK
mgnify:FL=1